MMRRLLLIAAAVAGLVACKPSSDKAGADGPAAPPPAAPAQAAGDWTLTIDPAGNLLEFKAGDAPSVLTLGCAPGSNAISLAWANAEPATLSSGSASQAYASHDAAAGPNDPVIAAFHESGEIAITQGGVKQVLRGTPDGRFAVRAFFQFCSKPS
jgi:hypothetical protein